MSAQDPPPAPDEDNYVVEDVQDDAVIGKAVKLSALVVGAVLCGFAAYLGVQHVLTKPAVLPPQPIVDVADRDLTSVRAPKIPFTDITEEAGITFVHRNALTGKKLLPETMVGGCATFDYDGDGDPDLLLVGASAWPDEPGPDELEPALALYRNDGTGGFGDVTEAVGLTAYLYGQGVAVGDYDSDGDLDIYITAVGKNRLYRNDDGAFLDVTDQMQVGGGETDWGTSAGFVDYDKDGDLDLVVCNYVEWSREFDLAQNFQLVGDERAYGRPLNFAGSYPLLFRNDGEVFTEVGNEAGLRIQNPDTGVPAAKSLGLAIHDFDADGWQDLCIANDTVRNFLFRNKKDGTFEEVGVVAGVAYDDMGSARGAMGIDVARFRSDGTVGIAIGNFANEMTALYTDPFGGMSFTDEAVASGLGPQTRLLLTFGVLFVDTDLDGRVDIVAANGHLEEDISKVQPSQSYKQPPQLFWNAGDDGTTEFVPLSEEELGLDFLEPMVGRGSAAADFDLDGDLDLVIAAVNGRPRLLRNDQALGHHWLRIRLESDSPVIGSEITLKTADGTQRAVVTPTRSYLSQSELPVHFGLGTRDTVEELTVVWPNGGQQAVAVEGVDQEIVVVRAE